MPDSLPVLPDEVVEAAILWRLPVKSILRCRSVCKSWYSLIKTPNFISKQIRESTLTKNHQFFLHQWNIVDKNGSCLLLFNNQGNYLSNIPQPCPGSWAHVVGSVKGLICFSFAQGGVNNVVKFILYNPAIGKFVTIALPPPGSLSGWECVKGFGFDDSTEDYKILLVIYDWGALIYSLNSNSWRVITCPNPAQYFPNHENSVVFVNGKLHWTARSNSPTTFNLIMAFDLNTEAFSQISLPDCLANKQDVFTVLEFGDSSISVHQRTFGNDNENHIWVMKEYGSVESWIKLATVPKSQLVLGFINENEVLFRFSSGHIASRKANNNKLAEEVKIMMDVDTHPSLSFSVHKYVPSLRLLCNS